jgi:ribosomal protein S27AE
METPIRFKVHQVECDRCGQLTAYHPDEHFYEDVVCGSCREAERRPQGEAMRLFAPAPNQIPGQMSL